jgi:hypothetical protein
MMLLLKIQPYFLCFKFKNRFSLSRFVSYPTEKHCILIWIIFPTEDVQFQFNRNHEVQTFNTLASEAEAQVSNISESSPCREENTTLHHYEDQPVNAV